MQKGEARRTMILCIDSYTGGVPCGRFYNRYREEAQNFRSLIQMLILMEKKLDEEDFPQAYEKIRTFGPLCTAEHTEEKTPFARRGKLASFSIRLLFRQNASWQGSIRWLEGNEEKSFRSVLEMVFLLDSALSRSSENSPACVS